MLVTVGLNLARGTYRHSVGDRIYGDVVVWLLGACIVRVVIFVMSRLSGMRNPDRASTSRKPNRSDFAYFEPEATGLLVQGARRVASGSGRSNTAAKNWLTLVANLRLSSGRCGKCLFAPHHCVWTARPQTGSATGRPA